MFGGFVRDMQNCSAMMVRSSLDAGSRFINKVGEHLGKETVAFVVKGILLSAGAVAAAAMLPAIAPILPAVNGFIGPAALTAITSYVGNMAADVVSKTTAEVVIDAKASKPSMRNSGLAFA